MPSDSMRCSNCGFENSKGQKFCSECGTVLQSCCAQCGADNLPTAKFCGECGVPLNAPIAAPVSKTAHIQQEDVVGERRHLTVLLSDLVGSTEISARLDPEEFRELVADYHGAAAEAITRFGGFVAKYLGDGVMAYFGWPEAHDNDAERAAHAGLAILEAVAALNNRDAKSDRPKLSVRVGIDTGNVVIGQRGGSESEIFGDAANIAARVQSAADPDAVIITPAVNGWFRACSWSPARSRDSAGERRHLTVMFCDLVGSTDASAGLDPEELRELEADYSRVMAEAIGRFDGFVAKYLGNGLMASRAIPSSRRGRFQPPCMTR
jgi:class 3 adenylate cyclase